MAVNVQKSRLRETCQLRFKFLLLTPVTRQYSSNICLFFSKKKYKNTAAWRRLKMCFLMSAQTTEGEPALVIHRHKLLAPT